MDPIQDHDRDAARRVALVLGVVGHNGRVRLVHTVGLASVHHRRPGLKALRSDLDGHDRVGDQGVIPGGGYGRPKFSDWPENRNTSPLYLTRETEDLALSWPARVDNI